MAIPSITAALLAAALGSQPSSAAVRQRIQALYDAGEYEQALTLTINEYRASDGQGVFLYAGANAAQALGDCAQATELYERALEKADNPQIKEAIAGEIQACRGESSEEASLPATFVVRWGEAERSLGHCEDATESYRRALRRDISDDEASTARAGIAACAPAPPPPVVGPTTTLKPPPKTPDQRLRPDRTSAALIGAGAGLALIGAGLIAGSAVDAQRAAEADERQYREQTERANTLLATGVAVGSMGVGVLVAATVRWAVLRRRGRPSTALR